MDAIEEISWAHSWLVGLPLVLVTVAIHVAGLSLIARAVGRMVRFTRSRNMERPHFPMIMAIATVLVTVLHGCESALWATAYYQLGAMPTMKGSTLYSLEAMTAYGHADVYLLGHWKLLGGLEALVGLMLMGLTTAFLYAIIQQVRPFQGIDPSHLRTAAPDTAAGR